jgi:hypothetical protein
MASPTTPDPQPAPTHKPVRPPETWSRRGLQALGALLLAVWFYSPVTEVADVQLDASNYASYAYFTAKHFQYGTDVMPMAGPYGFVPYGFSYAGFLFWKRLPLELITKLVLGVLIVWYVRRTPGRLGWNVWWLLSILLFAPLITDLPYALAILLSGLCLAECHVAADRRSLLTACGLAAYLALLTLFKGTQSMLACATLGLLCLQAGILRDFRRLPWILATYMLALTVWLALAGQNPLNLPRYLGGMLEISSGYNLAMGVQEPLAHFATGLGAAVALLLLLTLTLGTGNWRQPRELAGGLYLAGFTFVLWKHGFVRADGHVSIFYHYAAIAVPTILLFAGGCGALPSARSHRWILGGLAVIAMGLALWGDGPQAWLRLQSIKDRLPARLVANVQQLAQPIATKAGFDAMLEDSRAYYRLARVQEVVGRSSIDFFGVEQGFLLLNRLNYRPRPVGGGTFSVFTPKLQQLNAAWLDQPGNRPEYFLVDIHAIDDRLATQEDANTLRLLLNAYAPAEIVMGLPLFKALPEPRAQNALRALGSQPLQWNQAVTVPAVEANEMLHVSFSLPPSLVGRMQNFLYKPPYVLMDLEGVGLELPHDRKIIPSMIQTPVPLSPLLESTDDLLKLYQGRAEKSVSRLVVKTAQPDFFDPAGMQVHFYAGPRPQIHPAPEASSRHPWVSDIEPDFIAATLAPVHRFDAMVAQILVPPGRMGFVLGGGENAVEFKFGMVPVTYQLPTDGVDIGIELERPGQPPQVLFQRNLKPTQRPADQGPQHKRVSLPPFPAGNQALAYHRPRTRQRWRLGSGLFHPRETASRPLPA